MDPDNKGYIGDLEGAAENDGKLVYDMKKKRDKKRVAQGAVDGPDWMGPWYVF